MKILDAIVEWHADFANPPSMKILVDRIPKMEELRFIKKGSLYYAELDGYVMFFTCRGPDNGYGGREFKLHMQDGTTKILKGPWSSGSYAMNNAGLGPCAEVSITNRDLRSRYPSYIAGAITVELLQKAVKFVNCYVVKHFDVYTPSLNPYRLVAWKIVNKQPQNVIYSNVTQSCYVPLENGISYLWARKMRNIHHV